jgi:hypothetical protein
MASGTGRRPDYIEDNLAPLLEEGELRVFSYIARRTFGFKKLQDELSLDQICNGIVKKTGERMDRGAGVEERTARKALKSLQAFGVISVKERLGKPHLITVFEEDSAVRYDLLEARDAQKTANIQKRAKKGNHAQTPPIGCHPSHPMLPLPFGSNGSTPRPLPLDGSHKEQSTTLSSGVQVGTESEEAPPRSSEKKAYPLAQYLLAVKVVCNLDKTPRLSRKDEDFIQAAAAAHCERQTLPSLFREFRREWDEGDEEAYLPPKKTAPFPSQVHPDTREWTGFVIRHSEREGERQAAEEKRLRAERFEVSERERQRRDDEQGKKITEFLRDHPDYLEGRRAFNRAVNEALKNRQPLPEMSDYLPYPMPAFS